MKTPKRGMIIGALAVAIAGTLIAIFVVLKPFDVSSRLSFMKSTSRVPDSIEGLRSAIDKYESKVQETVRAAAQAGDYWKLLAIRYLDRNMYGEALDALKTAITYFPEDPSLHYMTGIAAAVMAKSSHDFAATGKNKERERLLALAESAQKRAISLDAKYARPLYALGVLLVFELDRSAEAIPYLEKYTAMQAQDTDAMFVLARAYYVNNRRDEAVKLYERILSLSKDEKKRAEATANKKTVLDQQYGTR